MHTIATWQRVQARLGVRLSMASLLLGTAFAVVPLAVAPIAVDAASPTGIDFSLAGCKGDESMLSAAQLCPDADYTAGDLGKDWNELDVVPMRLTATTSGSAPASQTYQVAVTAGYMDKGTPGFDYVSAPVLNSALSDASCTAAAATAVATVTPGTNNADTSIYRELSITQLAGSTCVYDYYQRLALGSHAWPGSALHSDLATVVRSDGVVTGLDAIPGVKTVPLPVNQSTAPSLAASLGAAEGTGYTWSLSQSPSPDSLSIGSTCTSPGRSQDVSVTVSWQRVAGLAGMASVAESVFADNPTGRALTASATATLFDAGDTQVAQDSTGDVSVPAKSSHYLLAVFTHTFPAGASASYSMSVAGGFSDPLTGQSVGSAQTASASHTVDVVSGSANSSATISYTAGISGAGLQYALDSVSLAGGSLGGYTAGTLTTGAVTWTSPSQSGDGSAVVHLHVTAGKAAASGTLTSSAAVAGSDGFTTEVPLSVPAGATAAPSCGTGNPRTPTTGGVEGIRTPNTGGDLPFGEAGVLVLAGSGLLAWGLRRGRRVDAR